MNDEADSRQAMAAISRVLRHLQVGYYLSMVVYLLLGIASITLPALAAMDLPAGVPTRLFSGMGALAAALFGFLKPYEWATGFDAGMQLAWKTKTSHFLGQISAKDVAGELRQAIDATTFKYGSVADKRNPE